MFQFHFSKYLEFDSKQELITIWAQNSALKKTITVHQGAEESLKKPAYSLTIKLSPLPEKNCISDQICHPK